MTRVTWATETSKMAETLRAIFKEMKDVLDVEGWEMHGGVRPYGDDTIDAEVRVLIPPERSDYESISVMVGWIASAMLRRGRDLKGCYLSTGWILANAAQERRRDENKPYRRYEGGLRMGFYYKPMFVEGMYNTTEIRKAFEAALWALQHPVSGGGILVSHGMAPRAFYVRLAWSKDGKLRRHRTG